MDKEIKVQRYEGASHKLAAELGTKAMYPDPQPWLLLLPRGLWSSGTNWVVSRSQMSKHSALCGCHVPESSSLETCFPATFTPSSQSLEVEGGENLRPSFRIGRVRHREAKCPAQGHEAERGPGPGLLTQVWRPFYWVSQERHAELLSCQLLTESRLPHL